MFNSAFKKLKRQSILTKSKLTNTDTQTKELLGFMFDESVVNFNLGKKESLSLSEYVENMTDKEVLEVDFSSLRENAKGELKFLLTSLAGEKNIHHANEAYQFIYNFHDSSFGKRARKLLDEMDKNSEKVFEKLFRE